LLVDVVAAIGRHRRRLDFGEILGEVVELPWRVMFFQERDHFLSDVAFVEAITCGGDPCRPPLLPCSAFRRDHQRKGAGELWQFDHIAGVVSRAISLDPGALVVRPGIDELAVVSDGNRGSRPQRKSALCVLNRAHRYLFEGHRSPSFEHGEGGVKHARYDGGIQPDPIQVLTAACVPFDCGAPRRPTLPDNRRHLVLALRIHEDETLAAQAVEILFHNAADEHRRHAGIEGVPAFQEDLERCSARQRVTGGDSAIRSGNRWAIGSARRGDRPGNDECHDHGSGDEVETDVHKPLY
jgi:hypothetical protein